MGERLEPARARPVPFWRPGLAPPPETRPRVLVAAVPRRRAPGSARTLWCTSGSCQPAANARSSSLTVLPAPSTGTSGVVALERVLARASGIAAHLHDAAPRARHRAAHHQQVLLHVNRDHLEPLLGRPAAAHVPGA